MIHDGYLPPVRNTEDIPIQRSVTAMGITAPAEPAFKPYRYRGLGYDQIQEAGWYREQAAKAQAAHWEAERKAAALRVQRQRREARQTRQREQSQREEQRQINSIPHLVAEMHAGIEAALIRAAEDKAPKPKKQERLKFPKQPRPIPPLSRKPARPAQGWAPLVGADLEDAWSLLEDE